jgi:hypothetical protein
MFHSTHFFETRFGTALTTGQSMLPVLLAAACLMAAIAPADAAEAGLDQERIHALYYSGKPDTAAFLIETFIGSHSGYSRNDSLFIAKYMGVIYSADPAKKESGLRFLDQWLNLDPSADIKDMFASDDVDSLFNRMKREKYSAVASPPQPWDRKAIRPWVWVAMGGGVAASLGAFLIVEGMSGEAAAPSPKKWTFVVTAPEE